ncbi:helix-turn-helix domain-containing protein [Defluviimonas denitrificans]|jgi:DNA-binding transcriptional regulator YdaS (Cro superfamily)|uniref:helix-turn-helix domain-containing protein n=1 Tax=Albidovulum denitrificans TaxID=404881 RepID=UPI0011B0DB50|nr:helix-turn-helix domain-containing protein [Defluviimonas denitrificans]
MEIVDGNWISARLTGARGEKKRLADHIGIRPDQLTKIITGERQVQPAEHPRILEFFGEGAIVPTELRDLIEVAQQLEPKERDFLLTSARALLAQRQAEEK